MAVKVKADVEGWLCDFISLNRWDQFPYNVYVCGMESISALKLYEETTSAEREDCMSLLPSRKPPSVVSNTRPVVLPLASNSLSLPTDPDAIDYPDKTLISVSATGAIGGLATEVRKELRSQDAEYCAKHFPGHVVLSPLDVVLARLGSSALVDKLTELKKVARSNLGRKLKEDVLAKFINESKTSSKPEECCIDGRYWLSCLADAASAGRSLPLALDYMPTPDEPLPALKEHGYNKTRKYDAALRPSAAARSNILNIVVNVEFTNTEAPAVTSNPLIGASANVAKYQQAIINADNLLTFQPTWLFVPTLSFHGKGRNTELFVSILSQERLELPHRLSPPTPLPNRLIIPTRLQPSFYLSPPPNFSVGDVVPASIVLPSIPRAVRLNGKHLSRLHSTPFGCATVVLEGELDEQSPSDKISTPVVVKLSFIAEHRQWREKIVVDAPQGAPPSCRKGPVRYPKPLSKGYLRGPFPPVARQMSWRCQPHQSINSRFGTKLMITDGFADCGGRARRMGRMCFNQFHVVCCDLGQLVAQEGVLFSTDCKTTTAIYCARWHYLHCMADTASGPQKYCFPPLPTAIRGKVAAVTCTLQKHVTACLGCSHRRAALLCTDLHTVDASALPPKMWFQTSP
ncbi:hypothetical protein B0H19DRAFT_1327234 [Mycena capillaripes]|nr:hypothetical protein B0H19DRAFT_1327234 [Mycena capillaripes]